MLSQAVIAAYGKPIDDGYHHGQLTVTSISSCPYATYINYHHLDDQEVSSTDRLRMKNGHWQEAEILEDLKLAGFQLSHTGDNQLTVHIGKSKVPGRPDGLIVVDSKTALLEIKAMSISIYTNLKQKGLESLPGYKNQVQLYIASEELVNRVDCCYLYAKHKDSCRPYDVCEEKDLNYSRPIIEAVDAIVLDKEVVKRPNEPIPLCTKCRHRLYCWKVELLDTSGTKVISDTELVAKWKEAKFHTDYGKELMSEVREGPGGLRELLGKEDLLLVEDLKVQKVVSRRTGISETKFVDKYGAAALSEVLEEKVIESMRVMEV